MKLPLVAMGLAVLLSGSCLADDVMKDASCKQRIQDYYPAKAIRLQQVGAVLVEFSVKGKGPPVDVVVVRSTAPGTLQEAAIKVIHALSCDPGQAWIDAGGPGKRIRWNVLFKLKGFDETAERLDPEADEVVITGMSVNFRG